ncbi:MAG: hypothetical protein J6I76_02450 [Oribacterium sp.]|nr:hypothetical protein [Oribacterium sp.]
MRVTASTFYKDYAKSVQDLKSIYNKSMQQVSSGKKYEHAYENPLDYYAGKKIDNLYNDVVTKDTMIKDVINRLEQQETTSRTFYSEMSDLNIKYEQMASSSYQGLESTVDTMHTYMLNKQQTMTQDLNATYENYYVMGGNDQTTIPFTMSQDGLTLSYHHKFPGDSKATVMEMKYDPETKSFSYSGTDANGNAMSEDQTLDKILTAMREQGRMSLGYGDINTVETLPDTYYGGLNMVTGLTSDKLRAMNDSDAKEAIKSAMNTSAFGLNAQAVDATNNYYESFNKTEAEKEAAVQRLNEDLEYVIGNWDHAMISVSNTFRRIGVATQTLEEVDNQLQTAEDTYIKEYNDHMAIDTYDAIVQMYQHMYSYNAAMQVGSKIMQNSLFDFVQ